MRPNQHARVILRHCDEYDVQRIRGIARDAMRDLDIVPRGRTLVKPNLVNAGELFEHAHTRNEFVEGVLLALQDRDEGDMRDLTVGERCGITIPTRFVYEEAKFNPMLKRVGVKRVCFEEVPQVEIPLTHEQRLRDYVFTPQTVANADFFVNCPKFKAHPWTTVTFSMKNYIGIQDDRHRLIDHDHALSRKVADLQYIIQPEFIAIDAIIAGEGRMLTPTPRNMNLIAMGNNQVAFDAVCCHIIGVDPMEVEHIRLAYERGFGPIDLDDISVEGDLSLDEAKQRGENYDVGLTRVEKYFEGSNINAYAGPAPGQPEDGYCWGGCPQVMEEVIEVLRLVDPECDTKLPRIHLVFGNYKGPLDVSYGEKVVFVGDCVTWDGRIGDEPVQIGSQYRERATKDPHEATHDDLYVKMANLARMLVSGRNRPWLRLKGCPVSVAELIYLIAQLGGIQNPYFDHRNVFSFNKAYIAWRMAKAAKWLRREPYQINGPASRGNAAPVLTAPAE